MHDHRVRSVSPALDVFHRAAGGRNESLDTPTYFELRYGAGHDRPPVTNLVVRRWWLGLEGFIPPPVGALAGGSGARRYRGRGLVGWARQRSWAQCSAGAVGDRQVVCGSGDGDDAAMVQPVMIGAYQHQVVQLGGPAVFPVPDVVSVQTAGGSAAGNRTRGVAVLEGTAKPAVDQAGRPPGADDLRRRVRTTLHRWHHTKGIGGRPRRAADPDAAQRRAAHVQVHHHGGVMPVGPARGLGVPPGLDQPHERLTGGRQRGP